MKFREKINPLIVEADLWDPAVGHHAVANDGPDAAGVIRGTIHRASGNNAFIKAGDVVFSYEDGQFDALPRDEFEARYELAEEVERHIRLSDPEPSTPALPPSTDGSEGLGL